MDALPRKRQERADAPSCDVCGRLYRARSSAPLVTYYYPECDCEGVEGCKKKVREIDVDQLDSITRKVLGI